jgi:hypothetical protein
MPPAETVFLRSIVKQFTGAARRPRYSGRDPGCPGPPDGADENATVGFLVVQVRGLGTVPGKIPQAPALMSRNRNDARASFQPAAFKSSTLEWRPERWLAHDA